MRLWIIYIFCYGLFVSFNSSSEFNEELINTTQTLAAEKFSHLGGLINLVKDSVCPNIAFCGSTEQRAIYAKSGCCKPCSCSTNCQEYGNCCPDVDVEFTQSSRKVECNFMDEIYRVPHFGFNIWTNTQPSVRQFGRKSYYIIDACPEGRTTTRAVDACSVETVRDFTPVIDIDNKRLYKNKKCAVCNGAFNLLDLKLAFHYCARRTVHHSNPKQTLNTFIDNCRTFIVPPDNFDWNFDCYKNTQSVSECKQTDLNPVYAWGGNYKRVEQLCENTSTTFPVYSPSDKRYFLNPFCFLCNMDEHAAMRISSLKGEWCSEPGLAVAFENAQPSIIFGPDYEQGGVDAVPTNKCSGGIIYNFANVDHCIELTCPLYHFAIEGGCQRYLSIKSNIIEYHVLFEVKAEKTVTDFLNINSGQLIAITLDFFQSVSMCTYNVGVSFYGNLLLLEYEIYTNDLCDDSIIVSVFKNHFKTEKKLPVTISDVTYTFTLSLRSGSIIPPAFGDVFNGEYNTSIWLNLNHQDNMFYCSQLKFHQTDIAFLPVSNAMKAHFEEQLMTENEVEFRLCKDDFDHLWFKRYFETAKRPTGFVKESVQPQINIAPSRNIWKLVIISGLQTLRWIIF